MSEQQQQQAPADTAAVAAAAEQAAIEKGQQGLSDVPVAGPTPSGPPRPEWCPEKFFVDGKVNTEALAKSYAELEKVRSQAPAAEQQEQQQAPADAANAAGKIEKPQAPAEGADSPLATAMEKARAEFSEGQAVSDETVAALEQAGIPKEIFGIYLQGLQAITEKALGEIHGFTGGKDNYDAMARWAAEKLSDAELTSFNSALDDPNARETAVRGLYTRYTTARPSEGNLITPAGTPSSAGDVYTDRSQLISDQRDPRYQTDAGFRQTVMDKLRRSQGTGFQVVARPMFERRVLSN